jgi:hypothetical protein
VNLEAIYLTAIVAAPGLLGLVYFGAYAILETLVPSLNPEN